MAVNTVTAFLSIEGLCIETEKEFIGFKNKLKEEITKVRDEFLDVKRGTYSSDIDVDIDIVIGQFCKEE